MTFEEISIGEVGPDLGFDETTTTDKSLKNKVVGDEPNSNGSNNVVGPNDIAKTSNVVVVPSRAKKSAKKPTSTFEALVTDRGRPRKATSTSKEPTRVR
ncbi:hypothetical protein HAX54_007514 [Datura stramonium]|uniref:Uncharacterized protein n=1 Tax=Datura stramonium TaxID=4076 RepID=A0ABS8WUQ2_DATST|nr:hypothetical protein [Datura stramonium]